MDVKNFFTCTLNELLNQEGFKKVSIEIYPNRFRAVYNYIHHDRVGNELSTSVVELIGAPVGSLLCCSGHILKSYYDTPDESVRTKLRLEGNLTEIVNQFKYQFIYRIKNALSIRITELPSEILYHLIEYLNVQDIMNLLRVNQTWQRLLDDDYIWRKMYLSTYGENPDVEEYRSDGTAICNWRNLVIREFIKRKRMEAELRFSQDLSRRSLPASPRLLALPPAF
ncbi:uncharacterized protein LOC107363925 [Tetranychus urticae]|uniref:F-box domain-containing protein n=1 Tax=Tetranychus urticae TaxID=32264 RepID=T1KGR0_TETUR|nr:uncharacterized protein LOC107363925 [Tetranychus urticae]